MTNAIRLFLLSAVFPLFAASEADACWLCCWKHHHSSHYTTTGGGGGGSGEAAVTDLTPSTESARRRRAELSPRNVSGAAATDSTQADPNADTQTVPSDIGTKLDNMTAQLTRIAARVSPESAAIATGTPESAFGKMILDRVAGKVLASVLQDFENRLGGLAPAAPVLPAVDAEQHDAEMKKALLSLFKDPAFKAEFNAALK